MRTGIMARKIGMTRVYNSNREHNSVTVLSMTSGVVLGHKKSKIHGYDALILGFEKLAFARNGPGSRKEKKKDVQEPEVGGPK